MTLEDPPKGDRHLGEEWQWKGSLYLEPALTEIPTLFPPYLLQDRSLVTWAQVKLSPFLDKPKPEPLCCYVKDGRSKWERTLPPMPACSAPVTKAEAGGWCVGFDRIVRQTDRQASSKPEVRLCFLNLIVRIDHPLSYPSPSSSLSSSLSHPPSSSLDLGDSSVAEHSLSMHKTLGLSPVPQRVIFDIESTTLHQLFKKE